MGFCEALSITKGFVSCDAADPYQQGIKEPRLERGRGFRSVLEQAGCWGAAFQGGFVLPTPVLQSPLCPPGRLRQQPNRREGNKKASN